jgi:hypothetical protein
MKRANKSLITNLTGCSHLLPITTKSEINAIVVFIGSRNGSHRTSPLGQINKFY